ncbi:MAG: methylmalonyl-CoA mutase family protein, partial [Vulcanimicrobiaceae bacterium]
MSTQLERRSIADAQTEWEQLTLLPFMQRRPERREVFRTLGGTALKRLYTPEDVADVDYADKIGFPGAYPYTRGPYPTMYRAQPWTMRQIAG